MANALVVGRGRRSRIVTEVDHPILQCVTFGHISTSAIVAGTIDRSRGAVSGRSKTLRAGGYVEKVDRGKYSITREGTDAITGDPAVSDEGTADRGAIQVTARTRTWMNQCSPSASKAASGAVDHDPKRS